MGKIRTFQAFAGYDSQLMALDKIKYDFQGFEYECVGWSEIDKYAIQAHNALFPDLACNNYGDISKIKWGEVPDFDFFTYSFPCQDISSAGRQNGFSEGSGTRSALLWECKKAIDSKRPKYLLMENVKDIVSKKFIPYFGEWIKFLESLGYKNYCKVLNAKDFGIPQNRERCFLVSILGGDEYFFPGKIELKLRLKDLLEGVVDEKYYINKKLSINAYGSRRLQKLVESGKINSGIEQYLDVYNQSVNDDVCGTISARVDDGNHLVSVPIDSNGGVETNVLVQKRTEYGKSVRKAYENGDLMESRHNMTELQPRVDGISNTITTVQKDNLLIVPGTCGGEYRIRKLTPKECFRLMGVSDGDIAKIQDAGISNSQQYKMAGNSIVKNNLYHIIRKLFVQKSNDSPQQLTLF